MTRITIDVEDTLANRLSEVAAQKNCTVSEYAASLVSEHTPVKKLPRAMLRGCLKGQVWMSDDFDAPLEEMKDYM
jgi:macrodomain Ter protein organizer (MatP/YcbG family)